MMEKLEGELVLVHPLLPVDPVSQQGKVGMIVSADLDANEILVSFGDRLTGLYESDALLTLKSSREVYQQVLNGVQTLEKEDYKILHQVNMLQDVGRPELITKAYGLLAESPIALKLATISLEDHIDLSRSRDQGLGKGSSLHR